MVIQHQVLGRRDRRDRRDRFAVAPRIRYANSPGGAASAEDAVPGFAELHAISNFTFLRGASHPEELVRTASELGYRALAIADECSVAGAVRAHMVAKELGFKLIVGAEFRIPAEAETPDAAGIHLVLLAPHRAAYGQLCELITVARRRAAKGEYTLRLADLPRAADCLALWIPSPEPIAAGIDKGLKLKKLLPNLWLCLELHAERDDLMKTSRALALSMRIELPVVASNGAYMHAPERQRLQDVLTAIRLKMPVAELGTARLQNAERHLKPRPALAGIYPAQMLRETVAIAERCAFRMSELRYEYPRELVPPGLTPALHLRQLTEAGARERWPDGVPGNVAALVEKELALIAELGYEYFFLTVHDIVRFARAQDILCQGRGSAANSAVCYCLGITEVDPARQHLLFERFVSKERNEPPDIDVDFEHERREEVIQYIYRRYSRERAALAATLITYRPRSAIRDVGKALGFDADFAGVLAKSIAWWDSRREIGERLQTAGIDPSSRLVRLFVELVDEILGFPRHLSQHVGGFVISAGPLAQLVPVENAAMPERTVIQWDKDDLESLGLLKVDVLGLGMLTAIRKTLAMMTTLRGEPWRMSDIPPEDPAVYAMLQQADSVGVFQVESRAQMSMLPRLKPENFYDLVIEVAIVRPGPIQGNMVHPYLKRRRNPALVTYSDDGVRRVLERTLGIPIFQEQVIELAMVAAGFTPGEADQLRRAMAAWKRRGGLEPFERKLIDGMLERGHDREFAQAVFNQIKGFGEYGFPESHAASFALLVYVSAWLKRHEPAAFYCGILNSLPMGFYSPSQLVQDAIAHGIEVRPVDVQTSGWDHRLEAAHSDAQRQANAPRCNEAGRAGHGTSKDMPSHCLPQPALRIGLRRVKALREASGQRIEAAQPFQDIDDLAARAALDDRDLSCLARAGALKTLSGHRYQAHWDAIGVDRPLPIQGETITPYQTAVALSAPGIGDEMLADYRYLGLSLRPHPLTLLRDEPEFAGCRTAKELRDGKHRLVEVAGIVTCRQRPSGPSGVVFMTLEDETGNTNVVVWKSTLDRYRAALLQSQLLAVKGIVEREGIVIHLIAGHVRDLSHKLRELSGRNQPKFKARNFH